ncbi:MAG TPA: C2 family cysteine protease [Phycisphaerae bacterium]|nr:C2 family cysteine protease [Phycisphaerae bacterium]
MPTTARSRKRSLSIENLESRFNLSTLGTSIVPKVQTASLSHTTHRSTYTPTRQSALKLSNTTTTPSTGGQKSATSPHSLSFGDTTIGAGSSTAIPVTGYSALSGAQIETVNGTPDIGYMSSSGADIEYTLNVAAAGTYQLNFDVAAASRWGSFDIDVNGSLQAQNAFNPTYSWTTYTGTTQKVTLNAGTNTLRINPTWGSQFNIRNISLTPISVGAPTTASASTPATTIGNSTVSVPVTSFSAISNSQIEYQGGVPDIGYVSSSGAYVEYTLNVQNAGNYNIALNTAAPSWSSLNVSVNGTSEASYSLNQTGSWTSFTTTTTNSVYLPSGTVTLRLSSAYGTQYNIRSINITPASSSTTTTATTTASTSVPATSTSGGSSFDASVNTQWMTSFNQLNIVAGSLSDNIYVSQSGSTIYVNVNGVTNSYTGSYGNIVVKAGGGNDTITVDSSVAEDTLLYGGNGSDTLKNFTSADATIVSIGGGYDSVTGNGKNTAYWVDSSDSVNASSTEWNAGDVHQVSNFWGGVSTQLSGQNLSDPVGTGATTRISNASLWGTGPTMSDVNQGQVSDCFLLGALQTMADTQPAQLRQLAVDLGDGTYAVQFQRGGTTTYVRVDGDLPANGYYANGLMYAHPGSSGDLWAPIIEKAYAEFRTGAWNYSSLNQGYFGSVFSDFGVGYTAFGAGDASYNNIVNALNSGKGVTIGTNGSISAGAPLIYSHTYTVTAAWTSNGVQYIQLRNPWGYDGAGNDGNPGDGLVTMTLSQLNQNLQAGTILT